MLSNYIFVFMSNKKQELLILREHMSSLSVLWLVYVVHHHSRCCGWSMLFTITLGVVVGLCCSPSLSVLWLVYVVHHHSRCCGWSMLFTITRGVVAGLCCSPSLSVLWLVYVVHHHSRCCGWSVLFTILVICVVFLFSLSSFCVL